jgi:hypothetical protein
MAVRLSALCTGCPLPPGRFLVLICVRGYISPRAIVQLKRLEKSEIYRFLKEVGTVNEGSINVITVFYLRRSSSVISGKELS